jgi:hypothetical protein
MTGVCVPSLQELTRDCLLLNTHPSVQLCVRYALETPLDFSGLGMACIENKTRIESVPNTWGRVPPSNKGNTVGYNSLGTPHAPRLTTNERERHDVGSLDAITKFTRYGVRGLHFRSDSFTQPEFWAAGRVPRNEYIAYPIEGRSGEGKSSLLATRICGDCLRLSDKEQPSFWAEVRIPPVNKNNERGTKRARLCKQMVTPCKRKAFKAKNQFTKQPAFRRYSLRSLFNQVEKTRSSRTHNLKGCTTRSQARVS